jgi:NAD(P)-dependent dehydrogenase (short-subunit alcohol dehydrogenase family)
MGESANLAGKTAVVVGFGNALGRAVARALAEAGANVGAAAASLDGDEVMEAKRAARDASKAGRASFSQAWDVTLPTNVQVSLKQLVKELGRPSILVYSPSVALDAAFTKTTDAQLAHDHGVVLLGAFYAARSFVRELGEERGAIALVIPDSGGNVAIATAAAGLRGLADGLWRELNGRVRVVAIEAGDDAEKTAADIIGLVSQAW